MKLHKNASFKTFIEILPFLWGNDWTIHLRIGLSLCVTFMSIVLNVSTPYVFKMILNTITVPESTLFIGQVLLILYGSLWMLGQVVFYLRSVMIFCALERGMRILSLRMFDQLHMLSVRFHIQRSTGAITSAIERAQYGFEAVFWGLLLFILPTIIEIIAVISVLTYCYCIYYSGLLTCILMLHLLFSVITTNRSARLQHAYNEKRSQSSARFVDSLLNAETVKYFGNSRYESEQCAVLLKDQESAGVKRHFSDTMVQLVQVLVVGIGLVSLTLISGNDVISGRITIGDFVLINGYLLQFVAPLHHFGFIVQHVRKGLNDLSEVIELIKLKSEIQDSPRAINLKISHAELVFDNISFGYDEQRPILNGISFSISAGKTIAIVGHTGAGKSTIARLLFRLYDVTGGRIMVNGLDIRTITQQSLQAAIGVVPQETILFNNTLYYNIAYGRPAATKQEVEQAIKMAHLDEFILRLPHGYNTIVGERGLKLSGGEKQRIAIARVILKNPSIYIFDEATSSLDSGTERDLQHNLLEISAGATTIIIAHRLSTVTHADEIIVLQHGMIVEQGSHQTLLQFNNHYANLWNKQILAR